MRRINLTLFVRVCSIRLLFPVLVVSRWCVVPKALPVVKGVNNDRIQYFAAVLFSVSVRIVVFDCGLRESKCLLGEGMWWSSL